MFRALKYLSKGFGQVFQALEHKMHNGVNNFSPPSNPFSKRYKIIMLYIGKFTNLENKFNKDIL